MAKRSALRLRLTCKAAHAETETTAPAKSASINATTLSTRTPLGITAATAKDPFDKCDVEAAANAGGPACRSWRGILRARRHEVFALNTRHVRVTGGLAGIDTLTGTETFTAEKMQPSRARARVCVCVCVRVCACVCCVCVC